MPAKSDNFTFLTASAVLVAEPHNPAIINPDFLRNKGIVPAEWAPAPDFICTRAFFRATYRNRLSVLAEPGRCIFEEVASDTYDGDYLVHRCAKEYAKALEYNYSALGLNWQVGFGFAFPKPTDWLKSRFFRPGKWQGGMKPTSFAFSVPAPGSAVCNFTLQTMSQTSQASLASTSATLMLDCNFHFDLKGISEKTARMSDILARGKEYESFLVQSIDKYLVNNLS